MKVGEKLPTLCRSIELSTLVRYAGASGDFNQIHYDADYAEAAGLDGIIGHGALAMALVSEAVTEWLGDSRRMRSLEVRFTNSYRLGDTLTVEGEVVRDRGGEFEIELRCFNQDDLEIIGKAGAVVRPAERRDHG